MASVKELRETLANKGVQDTDGLSKSDLETLLELSDTGATQEEIAAFLKSRGAKASESEAKSKSYTKDEVDAIVAKAATDAIAKYREASNGEPVMVVKEQAKKPRFPDRYAVPQEFWSEKTLKVYVNGNNWTLTEFRIKGRSVEVPTAQIIPFRNDPSGEGIQRFGNSENLVYRCYFETNDQRLIDLFMQDDRMGGFMWVANNKRSMTRDEIYGGLVAKRMMALASVPHSQVVGMLKSRNLPLGGNLEEMRQAVANYDAKTDLDAMKKRGSFGNDAEEHKAQLLSGRS